MSEEAVETLEASTEEPVLETEVTEPEPTAESVESTTPELTAQQSQDLEQFQSVLGGSLPENTSLQLVDGVVNLIAKVDGVNQAFTVEDIIRNTMKNASADERLEKAKEEDKKAKGLTSQTVDYMKYLMANPEEYYKQRRAMGISDSEDADYFAQELERRIAYEQMTPEQKELEQLRQEKAARIKAEEEQKVKDEELAGQAEVTELEEQYSQSIIDALKENGIEADADDTFKENAVKGTLYYMLMAKQQGIKDYTPTKAVNQVLKDTSANMFQILGNMSDDKIRALVPDNVKKALIGSNSTAGITSIPTSKSLKGKPEPKESKKKTERKNSMNDFFQNL